MQILLYFNKEQFINYYSFVKDISIIKGILSTLNIQENEELGVCQTITSITEAYEKYLKGLEG